MVHDVGSSTSGSLQCDLSTESGVLAALSVVRGSTASSRVKAELRDLIFNYRASGGDPLLRTEIETQLGELTPAEVVTESPAHDVPDNLPTVEVTEVPMVMEAERTSYGFPSGRPAPRFEPVPVGAVKATSVGESVVTDRSTTSIPVRVAERVITPRVVEPEVPVPESVPIVPPSPLVEPTVEMTPPAPLTPEPSVGVSNDAAKNRIAEIKQRVNEKVGNAVNLLDRDNAIGREYMTALLEAMKATASNGNVHGAMSRLEAAFSKVEALLAAPAAPSQVVEDTTEVIVAPVRADEAVPAAPTVEPIVPLQSTEVDATVAMTNADISNNHPESTRKPESTAMINPVLSELTANLRQVASDTTPVPIQPVAKIMPVIPPAPPIPSRSDSVPPNSPVAELTANLRAVPTSTSPASYERSSWDSITAAEGAEAVIQPLQVPPTPVTPRETTMISPVSDNSPLKTPADLPTAQELKERSGVVDPLLDVDVDNGLEQLLSEWSLFRKSGIFGTGPKGRQHPLYVTLAPINMSLILSGRFEGATPEIRQSISDYMNGWRYEQGILHQPEETFEHYLRRVIRHIIDLQSKPRR